VSKSSEVALNTKDRSRMINITAQAKLHTTTGNLTKANLNKVNIMVKVGTSGLMEMSTRETLRMVISKVKV